MRTLLHVEAAAEFSGELVALAPDDEVEAREIDVGVVSGVSIAHAQVDDLEAIELDVESSLGRPGAGVKRARGRSGRGAVVHGGSGLVEVGSGWHPVVGAINCNAQVQLYAVEDDRFDRRVATGQERQERERKLHPADRHERIVVRIVPVRRDILDLEGESRPQGQFDCAVQAQVEADGLMDTGDDVFAIVFRVERQHEGSGGACGNHDERQEKDEDSKWCGHGRSRAGSGRPS